MTFEQLALIATGFIFNALTFGLGIFVGVSMQKRS
jgi:hypothetical protein